MKICKDTLPADDHCWTNLISKPSDQTSGRQEAPSSSKSVPTREEKGKKRMIDEKDTGRGRDDAEGKRRKREAGGDNGTDQGEVRGTADGHEKPTTHMSQQPEHPKVWVQVPPMSLHLSDLAKRKKNSKMKRPNLPAADEEDLVRVKEEYVEQLEGSRRKGKGRLAEQHTDDEGDGADGSGEDNVEDGEGDESANGPSSRLRRPRRTVKEIGYVEVSDEEPPTRETPKRTMPQPVPALKPTNTLNVEVPEELAGECENCQRYGLLCFTEWVKAKSTQTACGYCHSKKIKCSLALHRAEFMKSKTGQAFYKAVTGKPSKPAPKKRGRPSTRAASRARSAGPSQVETIQDEASPPPKVPPAPRGRSKTPKARTYKTPSTIPSDSDDYTDAPKRKRVRLVDATTPEKLGKVTTRAPLSKQVSTPPSQPKPVTPVSKRKTTARPLSAQAPQPVEGTQVEPAVGVDRG